MSEEIIRDVTGGSRPADALFANAGLSTMKKLLKDTLSL
jgi:hypothetical protein